MLIVANHTGWLDIVIFSAVMPLSFVAKSEVDGWPFFGTLARLQRTVFVERARRSQTGEARDAIRERLLAGDTLVLFPEGTSSDGNEVLPFKSALLGAAEAVLADGSHVTVQPVSTALSASTACRWGGKTAAFCLVWRHGTGAASVGGAESRPAGCGGAIPSHPFSLDSMDRKELAAPGAKTAVPCRVRLPRPWPGWSSLMRSSKALCSGATPVTR